MCDVLDNLKITEPDRVKKYTKDTGVLEWKYPLLIDIIGSWFGWPLIELIDERT